MTTYNKLGTIIALEKMRIEHDLPESIMKDLYVIVEDEKKCKEILEHGPYATVGDPEKAINMSLGGIACGGKSNFQMRMQTKSMKQLYKEQGKKYKNEASARRLAKLKCFLTKKSQP